MFFKKLLLAYPRLASPPTLSDAAISSGWRGRQPRITLMSKVGVLINLLYKVGVPANLIVCFVAFLNIASAQPYVPAKGKVFNDSVVSRVDIIIDPDSLNEILTNVFSNHEFPATFIFNDGVNIDTVYNIGFRLRGNTSRTAGKKSFKVSFNTFVHGQKFSGIEKMNLNGEHNDPSIVRSKLFWETGERMRLPFNRSNHVELYINGNYYGLYINVEHEDENFLKARYLNNWGNYYKCLYPADLAYLGTNPDNYKITSGGRRVYNLKINDVADDYTDLKNFITKLTFGSGNVYQNDLEEVFNVNSFLRIYAFDILTGNWDNYAGNMNNYYLYHNPETDKIDYIPYDVDNTYGIDFLGHDWGTRDIYNWQTTGNRQLITQLFSYQDYRDRFSFFMNKMIQGAASSSQMNPLIDSIQTLIDPYVVNDTYHTLDYGYTYNDFIDSYTQALGGHAPYGLKPYITTRNANSISQLVLNNVAPIFSETRHIPYTPYAGDSVYIKSWVEDENVVSNVYLKYKIGSAGILNSTLMYDDAQHYDDKSGDEIFGAGIAGQSYGDTIFYYLENTDGAGNTGREPRLGFKEIIIGQQPQLFINELMASNSTSVADNFGEYDDWFEIYNAGANTDMHHIFITDDFTNPGKWNVGDTVMNTNGFMLLWADEQQEQGRHHTNFKLSASGEQIAITEYNGIAYRFIDSLTFGQQVTDVSIGCYPDGTKPIINLSPVTPGYSNVVNGINDVKTNLLLTVYPNPANSFLMINNSLIADNNSFEITICNVLGGKVFSLKNQNRVDVSNLTVGVYVIELSINHQLFHSIFVKQ
ncbi:MAG: CotH kinase family protein [Bacteroidia bacterium]